MLQYLRRTQFDYPDETLLTENGCYSNVCSHCKNYYHGHKRSFVCYPCKIEGDTAWSKLTLEEQHDQMSKIANVLNEELFKNRT